MNSLTSLIYKLNYKPLAMLPDAYSCLTNSLETLADLNLEDFFEEIPVYEQAGKVSVININGALMPKASMIEKLLGVASYAEIRKALKHAEQDDSEVVILNIDSPGGVTNGVSETAEAIQKLSQSKHIISYCSDTMASAAYWLGAQANEIIVSPSATVGSIGVYIAYLTYGKSLEQQGITPVIVQKGSLKTIGLPAKEPTAEELEYLEGEVVKSYNAFKVAVSHRNLSESVLQGQTFDGADSIELNLADGLESDLENLIDLLNK